MTHHLKHPTQLWVSDHKTLHDQMIIHLQKLLCSQQGCLTCITCKQIMAKEHPWVMWVTPERSYNLEQIDEVISLSGFQLDENERRFFIFPQAERLTDQCSNRLLKTIEEPFVGYNFFFLAARPQALPLTIQSRCVVQKFTTQSNFETYKDFLHPFLHLKFTDPISFIKQLETLDIKEQETKELTDDLFDHWSKIMKTEIESINPITEKIVIILQQAIINQPMTGSAKIFWKNLYIATHHATKISKNKN
ncbi:hypothetical protein KBC04_04370 [Candidatus Babeliales bacterium]|nr:hypothetical protein [Candidatus Babeliales bacterium]MBP9844301.1 hypothetical protein [Candidatus Babeliales bacterium]